MNSYDLLKGIGQLRPGATSLIQTILEAGSAGGPSTLVVQDEKGRLTVSLRTIVRAMEVLDDFTKRADYEAAVSSRVTHAYSLVERAISGERVGSWSVSALKPGGPGRGTPSGDV